MKTKRVMLYQLTPFERQKLKLVEELMTEGINPLTVSVHSSSGSSHFNCRDIRHWHMKHSKNFFAVIVREALIDKAS